MKDYPNREALRKAHDIYRDAMRSFIVRCLKRIRGEQVEDLIRDSLSDEEVEQFKEDLQEHNGNIEAAIDIKHFPHIIRKYWHRDRVFSQQFNSNSKVQYNTGTIVGDRNLWAHPGVEDIDPERTRANLTHVAEILGEINNQDAKREVEDIRNRLFSHEDEEHVADVSDQLEVVRAENTELKKQFNTISGRLEEVETEWIASEERLTDMSNLLKSVEAENADLKECLSEKENCLQTVESESAERITTLTERLRTVEAGKTRLEERPQNSPIEEWRRKIWKQLCDYAAQKNTPVRFQKPGSAHYLNVSRSLIAFTGFNMNVWLGRDNREIAIRLYMSKQNFYTLEKQRKEIEQEFRESLEWEKLPQRRESRISLRKDIIDPTDESDWQNQYEWVISKLEKFHKKFNEVFLPRI